MAAPTAAATEPNTNARTARPTAEPPAYIWVSRSRQAVQAASEAIECFGGAGYMEDTGLARLLRDAQVLPIWEGTTNVLSLDVTRLLGKSGTVEAFAAELTRLGRRWQPQSLPQDPELVQPYARRLAFEMAIEWIGGLVFHAASASPRAAELAALWESDCEPASVRPGAFERIVDGAA